MPTTACCATTWPTPASCWRPGQDLERGADGKTYSFELKPGLKFASGNPLTAEDVVWSLQRAVLLDKTPAFILTQFGFTKDNVKDKIKQTGPLTLTLTTDKAYAPTFVLNCLTANVAAVVDKKLVLSKETRRTATGLRLAEDQLRRVRPAEDPRVARQRGRGAGAQRQLLGPQVNHGARDLPPPQGKPPRSACCWRRATPTSHAT
jgi:hypothetical protein